MRGGVFDVDFPKCSDTGGRGEQSTDEEVRVITRNRADELDYEWWDEADSYTSWRGEIYVKGSVQGRLNRRQSEPWKI